MGDENKKESKGPKEMVFDATVGRGYSPSAEGNYFHIITGAISGGEIELNVDFGKHLLHPYGSEIMPEGLGRCNLLNAQKIPEIIVLKHSIRYAELDGETYDHKAEAKEILEKLKANKGKIENGAFVEYPLPPPPKDEKKPEPKKLVMNISSTKPAEPPKEQPIAEAPKSEPEPLKEFPFRKGRKKK